MEGKKSVSVHNLRSLYGAIAVYFFCPPLQHEYVFVQHFLGHVMDSPATGHYFRFALGDEQGNLVRDKGILLAKVKPLPLGNPLESLLLEGEDALEVKPTAIIAAPQGGKNQVPQEALAQRSNDLQSLRAEWFAALERLRAEFEAQLQLVRQESDAGWFIRRVEGLERENLALRLERDQAIATHSESILAAEVQGYADALKQLQAENAELAQKLKLAQDKLDSFRRLLNGSGSTDAVEDRAEPTTNLAELTLGSTALTPDQPSDQPPSDSNLLAAPLETLPQSSTGVQLEIGTTGTKPLPKTRGPKAGRAFQRAEEIVLGIKDWNRLYPSESFAINAGLLETVFKVHRQAVKSFFEAYQNELWEYHQEIGVESLRWHNRGKDPQKLKAFVTERMQG